MTTIPTYREGKNFRDRDAKRLNQWFRQRGLSLDKVESSQLEIREKGFRDTDTNAVKTAYIIAQALRQQIWP